MIHPTNAARALNRVIPQAIETRGSLPSEDAAEKPTDLAIREHEKTTHGV